MLYVTMYKSRGGDVVRKDGKRVLEYCNKALELTGSDLEEVQVNESKLPSI